MGYTMGYIDSQPMAGTLLFIYCISAAVQYKIGFPCGVFSKKNLVNILYNFPESIFSLCKTMLIVRKAPKRNNIIN